MERVRQKYQDISYPPVYFGTLRESLESRDEHIEATAIWAELEADKAMRISYGLVDRIERIKAALKGVEHVNPGFAVIAMQGIEHDPSLDAGLEPNEITIKDETASKVVQLPKGRRLKLLNEARSMLKIPQLDVKALRERFWRGNVVIYNAYRNGPEDKSMLVYFDQKDH